MVYFIYASVIYSKNLNWKKKNLRISWTSNLSLQECLLKYKWLSVVTFYDMYVWIYNKDKQAMKM